MRTSRASSSTIANDTAIVMTITPVAGRPIRAISPRLSRAPSRMIPRRRTRCEAKASPAVRGAIRGPATVATTIPMRIATVTSATIAGRNPVTSRAARATRNAAARPGAILVTAVWSQLRAGPAGEGGAVTGVACRAPLTGERSPDIA